MRRITNSFRRGVMTSLRFQDEVRKASGTLVVACKAMPEYISCLEAQCWEGIAR